MAPIPNSRFGDSFCLSSFSQITNSSTNVSYYTNCIITTITTTIINGPTASIPILVSNTTPSNPSISTTNAEIASITNIISKGTKTPANGSIETISADIANDFIDTIPYLKNNIISFDTVGIYNPSLKLANKHDFLGKFGLFQGVDIPIGSQAALGAGVMRFNNQWGLVPISLKAGFTVDYPIIGNVFNYVATSPYLELGDDKLGTYDFVGFAKVWDFGTKSRWRLSLGPD